MTAAAVDALFRPFALRGLTVPNRIAMSPMTRQCSPGRVPGENVADYYARRAAAGVGLIVTEGVAIDHPAAVDYPDVPQLHGDAAIVGWRRVTDRVHAAGGRIIPQLWHQGPMRDPLLAVGPHVDGVRPSGHWGEPGGTVSLDADFIRRMLAATRPATDGEITDVIDAYVRAATTAIAIGFDGIAIHGAHGYLIDSFLWHATNHRDDRWGGDDGRRAAFAVAVVQAVRDAIGPDLPILFRFSQFKMQDYRARLADTPEALGALLCPIAAAGVDLFDASQRHFDQPGFAGSDLNLAGWAKRLTGVASMTVGGIGMGAPRDADGVDRPMEASDDLDAVLRRLDAGEFDLIAVGRALLNDANWVARLRDGRPFLPFDRANLTRLT